MKIHKVCNMTKKSMSQEDFKSWIIRIYNHWGSK